jgi:hypothetical protein
MTGGLEKGFTDVMTQKLGKNQVSIVRHCKPGRGIRFWVKDYHLPNGHAMVNLSKDMSNGEEYPKLLATALSAGDAKGFASVTFIWMQGESDAGRDLGVAYSHSFKTLTQMLKTDLGLKQMNIVIGRISDYGLHDQKKAQGWKMMRAVQMEIAAADEHSAWVDTDDLNGGDENNPGGDIHYPKDEYPKLGARLAEKALEFLKK